MSTLTDAWDILIPGATPAKEETCKGLVFRGYRNFFTSKERRIELRQGVRLLKRLSCPGCDKCGWYFDYINEDVDATIFPATIKDGALYSVRAINMSKDWETGYIDAMDVEIYELAEESA
jgi:hypothetical protein